MFFCLLISQQILSSDSEDDLPLAAIRGIRDLVNLTRKRAADAKAKRLSGTKTFLNPDEAGEMDQLDLKRGHEAAASSPVPSCSHHSPSTPKRGAAETARKNLSQILLDESGNLDDSDEDPDYQPTTPKRPAKDTRLILPGIMTGEARDRNHNRTASTTNNNNKETGNNFNTSTIPCEGKGTVGTPKKVRSQRRLQEKIDKKKTKLRTNHAVKPGCNNSCKRFPQCLTLISEDQREDINKHFWSKSYPARAAFILERVVREEVTRHKRKGKKTAMEGEGTEQFRKNYTYTYRLNGKDGKSIKVCKSFFLETLGFNKSNDSLIMKTFRDVSVPSATPCMDRRGKHSSRKADVDSTTIMSFIETYNPQISHHAREKTPHRRYLPGDISVKLMHASFLQANPESSISYSSFYKIFKSMKISICDLGNEDCEICEMYVCHKRL